MLIQYKKQKIEMPEGCSAKELAEKMNLRGPDQSLAAKINGKMCDLATPLKEGDRGRAHRF